MIPANKKRYVLMERDGVINRRGRCGSVKSWDQVEFLPRELDALRLLAENDCIALIVSSQPALGHAGLLEKDLQAITRRLLLEVALSGGNVANVYSCVHAPSDFCDCQKPRPGLLRRAQLEHGFTFEDTFVIDDSVAGMHAAEGLGCPAILIRREAFLENRRDGNESYIVACNLYEAVEMILATHAQNRTNLREPAVLAY